MIKSKLNLLIIVLLVISNLFFWNSWRVQNQNIKRITQSSQETIGGNYMEVVKDLKYMIELQEQGNDFNGQQWSTLVANVAAVETSAQGLSYLYNNGNRTLSTNNRAIQEIFMKLGTYLAQIQQFQTDGNEPFKLHYCQIKTISSLVEIQLELNRYLSKLDVIDFDNTRGGLDLYDAILELVELEDVNSLYFCE